MAVTPAGAADRATVDSAIRSARSRLAKRSMPTLPAEHRARCTLYWRCHAMSAISLQQHGRSTFSANDQPLQVPFLNSQGGWVTMCGLE